MSFEDAGLLSKLFDELIGVWLGINRVDRYGFSLFLL